MNKKLFLGMFAAAGMLLATSCSNDELDVVQSGNEAQVTFSLATEGGIATRAISDGTGADKLVYAVYKLDEDGNPVLQEVVGSDNNGQFVKTDFKSGDNVSVTLAKGQTYQVAFWAQDGDCKAYDTDDLTAVGVNYKNEDGTEDAVNNDELRDAFFKMVEFEVAGDKTIDVVLKRPFAQINVGVDAEDWEAAVASGIEIEKSAVVVKNAANTINLLTGAVTGNETVVTYVSDVIPDETLYVETDATKDGKEAYNWLSMSYILVADANVTDEDNDGTVGDSRTTLESLQFTFSPKNGNPIEFKEGLNSVPVQRNWRTNILGKILTGDIQFNITIDPVYDGDIIYPDATAKQELEFVATFGGTYIMNNAQALDARLNVNADLILEGQGNTLNVTNAVNYGVVVLNGTTTLNNVNIISDQGGVAATNGAKVVFNGGDLTTGANTNPRYNFYVEGTGSTVTINGGNFSFTNSLKRAYIYAGEGTTVYVNGGTFGKASTREDYTDGILGSGTVIITGGTFGFDPSKWVADGYVTVKNVEGDYTVYQIDAPNRTITINSKEEFMALNYLNENWNALFSNGQGTTVSCYYTQNGGKGGDYYYDWDWTIKLNVDIDLEDLASDKPIINISKWKLFDGQNHTIKNASITTSTTETTDAGLFYATRTVAIKNLSLDNITVKGSLVGNSNAGILCGSCAYNIDNITVSNSSVWGGKYTGAVVGYTYGDVTNCTVTNCEVSGGYKCGGIVGYVCASGNDTNPGIVDNNTLTGCTVEGTDGQYAGGKSEYILGKVVGNFNCNGTCLNNTINTMTTDATKNIGQIEAGMVVEGQVYYANDAASLKEGILASGNVVLESDITVDTWTMYSETLSIAAGTIITTKMNGLNIDGNGHTLKVNSIESAGNGNNLFHSATNLNISNLTIEYADGLAGGIGLKSGVISNVTFDGGTYSILPGNGTVKVENCTFASNGTSIYFEEARDNLTVTGCTFNNAADANIILLRGAVQFTNNIVNSGRTVNVVSGAPVVTGNDFTDVRLKVYAAATATISNNTINTLEFEADKDTYASTFENNNLSDVAQNLLDSKTKSN